MSKTQQIAALRAEAAKPDADRHAISNRDPDRGAHCPCTRGDIPTRRARAAVSRRHREAMARAGKRHTGRRVA